MEEPLHAPHGMPKWLPIVAGALLLLWLLSRSKAAGASSGSGVGSAAADPLQRAAAALQLQALQDNVTRNKALSDLDLKTRQNQAAILDDYTKFYTSLGSKEGYNTAYMCPTGKPRKDPATGQVYCRQNVGGGVTFGSVLGGAFDFLKNYKPAPGPL